ncbi:hypothetical protein SPHINGOT1_270143 [Sphingomonas sp. T1]|nr:hypothetical protein SPHINGOT1_270143 [Sphingomonas sp. T1]
MEETATPDQNNNRWQPDETPGVSAYAATMLPEWSMRILLCLFQPVAIAAISGSELRHRSYPRVPSWQGRDRRGRSRWRGQA